MQTNYEKVRCKAEHCEFCDTSHFLMSCMLAPQEVTGLVFDVHNLKLKWKPITEVEAFI